MRLALIISLLLSLSARVTYAQLEITSGYAVNRLEADGVPIHIAYDIKLKDRIYTKSQAGYKYLYHFNDFVEATLKFSRNETTL
jgi:hypothetical protein